MRIRVLRWRWVDQERGVDYTPGAVVEVDPRGVNEHWAWGIEVGALEVLDVETPKTRRKR